MAQVTPLNAFDDNYIWALTHTSTDSVVVDPGDAVPVLDFLKAKQKQLSAILITHHHWDHTNGVAALKAAFPECVVYGPANSPFEGIDVTLTEGDTVTFWQGLTLSVLATPGHTLDHISYVHDEMLFCGDTLFSGGCGRLFEGTAEQMWQSLRKLKALPSTTPVYCTHEYTLANLAFAKTIEPINADLADYQTLCQTKREQGLPTLPTDLATEAKINPFLRADEAIQRSTVELSDDATPAEVFAAIRKAKDAA